MSHEIITSPKALEKYCRWLRDASLICFDTEFVSEYSYRPQLCLVQVAACLEPDQEPRLTVIDPLAGCNPKAFWEVVAAQHNDTPSHETVVHAGRAELEFCYRATGRPPANLFDVQLAAGLVGTEYPLGYGSLISKYLGGNPQKGETRTDWRRRPLSTHQLEYALDDVRYLKSLRDVLHKSLEERGRMSWMQTEMQTWHDEVHRSISEDQWRKVSGSSGLGQRELAVVRALWLWREEEAERRDKRPRSILRDDLIVELARRKTGDAKRIHAVRGFERRNLKSLVPDLAQVIDGALNLPKEECPQREPRRRREQNSQHNILGQFLSSAVTMICRSHQVAPSMVGGPSDVRDYIAHRLGESRSTDEPPPLTQGWRAEVVGKILDELLEGKRAIRVVDPQGEQPLGFEPDQEETSAP